MLQVRLDGFTKREWVTDDDEWEWLETAGGAAGPWPLERWFRASLRTILAKLAKAAERLSGIAKAEPPPPPKGKRAANGGADSAERKRAKKEAPFSAPGAALEAKAGKAKRPAASATAEASPAAAQASAGEATETPENGGSRRRKRPAQ